MLLILGLIFPALTYSPFIPYQGRLFQTDGDPLSSGQVELTIQVRDPSGSCLLFEEKHTAQMADSSGYFSLLLGAGTQNTVSAPGFTISSIFSNASPINDALLGCTGNSYTPQANHHRLLRIFVDGEEMSPDQIISSTPYSLNAENAQTLAGASYQDITTYADQNLGGSVIPPVSGLASGQSYRWNGSAWEAFTPGTSSISAGNGLQDTSGTFSVRAGSNISVDAAGVHIDRTNLDADLLDGQDSTFYRDFDNLTNLPTGLADGDDDTTYTNATGATAGLMAAADKTKLDGIESAATADQTAAEILAATVTVDGAGSGLDADLLDGLSSSSFVQTESDPTVPASIKDGISWAEVSGKPTIPDGNSLDASDGSPTNALVVDAAGNIGIGTSSPNRQLEVAGPVRVSATSLPSSPATGDIAIDSSDSNKLKWYDGSTWQAAGASSSASINSLTDASTAGSNNLFMGAGAGPGLTTGYDNVAIGANALNSVTSGESNVAIGSSALLNNNGYSNIGIGYNAMSASSTEGGQIAIGYASMDANTTGYGNIAIGMHALGSNVDGSENNAFGADTMRDTTSGSFNSAFGYLAMRKNTTGEHNVAFGNNALYENRTGSRNTALGFGSNTGGTNQSINDSVLVGYNAGADLRTGADQNILIGSQAGDGLRTGDANIIIGYNVDTPTNSTSNHLNIGNTIYGDLSSGNIGVGTVSPASALEVNGAVRNTSSISNSTSTINFATGNLQYTTSSCGVFNLHNLKDGGTYTLAIQGTTSATCSFSAYSDAGTTGLTVKLPSDHGATVAGKHTLYSLMVMGGFVYVAWNSDY